MNEDPAIEKPEPPKKVFWPKKFPQKFLCIVSGFKVEGVQDICAVYQSGKGKSAHFVSLHHH